MFVNNMENNSTVSDLSAHESHVVYDKAASLSDKNEDTSDYFSASTSAARILESIFSFGRFYSSSQGTPQPTTSPSLSDMTLSANILGATPWQSHNDFGENFKSRDPVAIEKSNLVNILKLVIKEVIESSLKFGRQLDSDHVPLQHFFIVLEHVLKHGLRPKKGLLGPKKELWDLLQAVEKKDLEALDITASVRELPTVKTPIGRARAWLRLALMQKKLADYFRVLTDQSEDLLADFYESRALLRTEEAILVTGLLVSLNVVDCNLFVKEEDLDSQQGVIDFSLYLRTSRDSGSGDGNSDASSGNLTAVLDQKHYVEEMNRHLNSTVSNMQVKIENLTTTNALMKEDLAIARGSLYRAQEENKRLVAQLEKSSGRLDSLDHVSQATETLSVSSRSSSRNSPIDDPARHSRLADEVRRREELERELRLQRSMKAEMEVAMKLMEKSVHEKQDTIISLREQLDDIKRINLEMYTKLQECQKSLKLRSELATRLEEKTTAMADILKNLDQKYITCESEKRNFQTDCMSLKEELHTQKARLIETENELKIEREWRTHLETSSKEDKETISRLKHEIEFLEKVSKDYNSMKNERQSLKNQIRENEKTLGELALQLSESKLQIDSMKEDKLRTVASGWRDDAEVPNCQLCDKEFNMSRRKHHCRHCGGIFCDRCSDNKLPLPSSAKPVRVCDGCHAILAGGKNNEC